MRQLLKPLKGKPRPASCILVAATMSQVSLQCEPGGSLQAAKSCDSLSAWINMREASCILVAATMSQVSPAFRYVLAA